MGKMGCVCLRKAQSAGYGVIGDAINLDILGGKKKKKEKVVCENW